MFVVVIFPCFWWLLIYLSFGWGRSSCCLPRVVLDLPRVVLDLPRVVLDLPRVVLDLPGGSEGPTR